VSPSQTLCTQVSLSIADAIGFECQRRFVLKALGQFGHVKPEFSARAGVADSNALTLTFGQDKGRAPLKMSVCSADFSKYVN
jgi:hypothetical protein